jgi:hypothetical protein
MYHADQTALTIGYMYELRILTEVRRHLDYMYHNPDWAKKLLAPDGSRAIFDTRNTKACKRYRTKLTIS